MKKLLSAILLAFSVLTVQAQSIKANEASRLIKDTW